MRQFDASVSVGRGRRKDVTYFEVHAYRYTHDNSKPPYTVQASVHMQLIRNNISAITDT